MTDKKRQYQLYPYHVLYKFDHFLKMFCDEESTVSSCLHQSFTVRTIRKPLLMTNLSLSIILVICTKGIENMFFLFAALFCMY